MSCSAVAKVKAKFGFFGSDEFPPLPETKNTQLLLCWACISDVQ